MDKLIELFGHQIVHAVIYWQEIVTLFLYFLALSHYKKRRKLYWLRVVLCFTVSFALCIPLAFLQDAANNIYIRILNNTVLVLTVLASLFICYGEKIDETLLCFSGIVAAKHFSGQTFALILNMFGINDLTSMSFFSEYNDIRDWAIYFGIHIILLSLVYIFLRKHENLQNNDQNRHAILLAVITVVISCVFYPVTRSYWSESFALAVCMKIILIFVFLLILVLRSNLFRQSRISYELNVTERLLHREKKHFSETKDNIEVINMKCHDLKHQLERLQGKLTNEEIKTLHEAITFYDCNIRTENEILDATIYQKQLICYKHGITLKFMADGKILSFIESADLYSLLSNALDNAIEAVVKIPDTDKKLITFNTVKTDKYIIIEISNYFDPNDIAENGTSKNDKRSHGFGIKSMRYVCQKYKGELTTEINNDIFFLTIKFPLKNR